MNSKQTYRVCLFFGIQYSYVLILAESARQAVENALTMHESALEASVWNEGEYITEKQPAISPTNWRVKPNE